MRRVFLVVLWLGCFAACSDNTSVAPTSEPVNVTGTWAGPIAVEDMTAQMSWALAQSNTSVSGPILISLPDGIVLLNGFLTGSVSGASLTYLISVGPGGVPARPTCTGQLNGTMAINLGASPTLVGPLNVVSSSCPLSFAGVTLTLTKR